MGGSGNPLFGVYDECFSSQQKGEDVLLNFTGLSACTSLCIINICSKNLSVWCWQVQQCLEHNAKLRSELNQVRMEQAMISASEQLVMSDKLLEKGGQAQPRDSGNETTDLEALRRENSKLKVCRQPRPPLTNPNCLCALLEWALFRQRKMTARLGSLGPLVRDSHLVPRKMGFLSSCY